MINQEISDSRQNHMGVVSKKEQETLTTQDPPNAKLPEHGGSEHDKARNRMIKMS